MGGRGRLSASMPRLLGRHDGHAGRVYRRQWATLDAVYDLTPPLARHLAGLVAVAAVNLDASTTTLVTLRHTRATGTGRRPSPRDVERAAAGAGHGRLCGRPGPSADDHLDAWAEPRARRRPAGERLMARRAALAKPIAPPLVAALPALDLFGRLRWLDGRPLLSTIEPYRRRFFAAATAMTPEGRAVSNLVLFGRAKKNAKTLDLCLAALWALLNPSPGGSQCFLLANDEGQACG